MKKLFCRLAYLFPALTGALMLILGAVPHLYFLYHGQAYETKSTFGLMSDAWRECSARLAGEVGGSTDSLFFAYLLRPVIIITWILIVLFAVYAIAGAVTSTWAYLYPPTDRRANLAKRWLRFFCPNRILWAVSAALPVFPALFPHLLSFFYRQFLGMEVRACFLFLPDFAIALILVALSEILCFATLKTQREEHLDLYQLYKRKGQP